MIIIAEERKETGRIVNELLIDIKTKTVYFMRWRFIKLALNICLYSPASFVLCIKLS